jgi:hypothetical protein
MLDLGHGLVVSTKISQQKRCATAHARLPSFQVTDPRPGANWSDRVVTLHLQTTGRTFSLAKTSRQFHLLKRLAQHQTRHWIRPWIREDAAWCASEAQYVSASQQISLGSTVESKSSRTKSPQWIYKHGCTRWICAKFWWPKGVSYILYMHILHLECSCLLSSYKWMFCKDFIEYIIASVPRCHVNAILSQLEFRQWYVMG